MEKWNEDCCEKRLCPIGKSGTGKLIRMKLKFDLSEPLTMTEGFVNSLTYRQASYCTIQMKSVSKCEHYILLFNDSLQKVQLWTEVLTHVFNAYFPNLQRCPHSCVQYLWTKIKNGINNSHWVTKIFLSEIKRGNFVRILDWGLLANEK